MSQELFEIQFNPQDDITAKELANIYQNLPTQGEAPKHMWCCITKKALADLPAGVRRHFNVRTSRGSWKAIFKKYMP